MKNKPLILTLLLCFGLFPNLEGQNQKEWCDASRFCFYKHDFKMVDSKKFYPVYLGSDKENFLGWFHFSDKQILYLSPLYQEPNLKYKQGNEIQVILDKNKRVEVALLYYLGRFYHCKVTYVPAEPDYWLQVKPLEPLPSHADFLYDLWINQELKQLQFKVLFTGVEKEWYILKFEE
jgi:hypothetical protein